MKFKRKGLGYIVNFGMLENGERFLYYLKEYTKISDNFAKELITKEIYQFTKDTLVLWEAVLK